MLKQLMRLRVILLSMIMVLVFAACEIDITIDGGNDSDEEDNGEEVVDNSVGDSNDENNQDNDTEAEVDNDTNSDNEGNEDDTLTDNGDSSEPTNDGSGESVENETTEPDADTDSDDNGEDTSVSIFTYLPMEVGYIHHVGGSVPDGFGEYVEVIGEMDGEYFLAIGGSTAMGFYRLYKVNDHEASIVFEANEEHGEYYDLEELVSDGHIDAAIMYALDHTNMNFVLLQGPLEEGTSWDDGVIVNTHVSALLTDDSTINALLVEYEDREELRYFTEDLGLVGIVNYSESVQELFGEAIYAKKIVE
ncbi:MULTISPECIES: hypothetical protein [Bacillaceae]|uniref:MSCRAMM family adhesin SdrC n=1 Tax=Evansella alkalicola TaxID=745819 RepID=A0ABS6JTB4_9BACI|nr:MULTISPECIES: hypothetical protein [Bacillaceae]MBU9721820.1 MSCRAMM family adhesin SdrC [Bacillus alkalicola]